LIGTLIATFYTVKMYRLRWLKNYSKFTRIFLKKKNYIFSSWLGRLFVIVERSFWDKIFDEMLMQLTGRALMDRVIFLKKKKNYIFSSWLGRLFLIGLKWWCKPEYIKTNLKIISNRRKIIHPTSIFFLFACIRWHVYQKIDK
jgi:hypothetical protein